MRWLKISIMFLPLLLLGQEIKKASSPSYPFQVLFAEKVFLNNKLAPKSLELISLHEKLTVDSNGYISFMHYSGLLLEFKGDTVISIYALNEHINNNLNPESAIGYSFALKNPHLDYLFIDNMAQSKRFLLSITGAISDGHEYLIPITGRLYGNQLYTEMKPCLFWELWQANKITVEASPYEKVTLTGIPQTSIAKWQLSEKFEFLDKLVLRVSHPDESAIIELKQYSLTNIPFPFSCSPKTATQALSMGMALEIQTSPDVAADYSLPFYEKAVELSNHHPFFQKMLLNAEKRAGRK